MRALITASLLALVALATSAHAGGKTCQVAASAVPTPGLEALATGSREARVPKQLQLTRAQIETLASLDTRLRANLEALEARAARLPSGARGAAAASAGLAGQPLSELVTRFLADATREQALVLDCETAAEFRLANREALEARKRGDAGRFCPLCLAVRRGVESEFAWKAGEFGALSPAEAQEAAALAAARDEARRTWKAGLVAELTPGQLAWLRESQMGWLKSTLRSAVASGMRSLGAKECGACATTVQAKCEFCSIVLCAVAEVKEKG